MGTPLWSAVAFVLFASPVAAQVVIEERVEVTPRLGVRVDAGEEAAKSVGQVKYYRVFYPNDISGDKVVQPEGVPGMAGIVLGVTTDAGATYTTSLDGSYSKGAAATTYGCSVNGTSAPYDLSYLTAAPEHELLRVPVRSGEMVTSEGLWIDEVFYPGNSRGVGISDKPCKVSVQHPCNCFVNYPLLASAKLSIRAETEWAPPHVLTLYNLPQVVQAPTTGHFWALPKYDDGTDAPVETGTPFTYTSSDPHVLSL